MSPAPRPERDATAVDRIADAYLDESLALHPAKATRIGAPGYDHLLTDYSPDGIAARTDLDRRALAELESVSAQDDIDRVSIAAMRERLGVAIELADSGADESDLNVIASPVQDVRSVFDLMPTDTAQDWATVAARLRAVPQAMQGYERSLSSAASRSDVSPRRQVESVIAQCTSYGGSDGFFVDVRRIRLCCKRSARLAGRRAQRRRADRGGGLSRAGRLLEGVDPAARPGGRRMRSREVRALVAGLRRRDASTSTRPTPGARTSWRGSSPRCRAPLS